MAWFILNLVLCSCKTSKNHSNYVCFHFAPPSPPPLTDSTITSELNFCIVFSSSLQLARGKEIWRWLSAKYVHQLASEIVTLPFPAGQIEENAVVVFLFSCFLFFFCFREHN